MRPLLIPVAFAFVSAHLLWQDGANANESTNLVVAEGRSTAPASIAIVSVLSTADVDRYKSIFRIQKNGDWRQADRIIGQLESDILMGHVLFDRYMHPTAYKSKYTELKKWMSKYADHPDSSRIYRLALKRRPSGASRPKKPVRRVYREREAKAHTVKSRRKTRRIRAINRHIKSLIRRERPTQAFNYLHEKRTSRDLRNNEFDDALALIAASYFIEGVDKKAAKIAVDVANRNRAQVPIADWTAGLSLWRLGQFSKSASHFRELAKSNLVRPNLQSAGGFWAARASLVAGEPENVLPMLEVAARHPRTFYGILARRQTGADLGLNWRKPEATANQTRELLQQDSVRRAVALAEIGQVRTADEELRRAHGRIAPRLDKALLTLSMQQGLAATQLQVADAMKGEKYDRGLYPVPEFSPNGGFRLDRALIYAFIRQESRFKSSAKSRAGARGLMQLMPRTASHVARDRSLARSNRSKLNDPGFNIALGQKYLLELMNSSRQKSNLFMVAAAYNGGPGNLNRWRRKARYNGDPLLFIESIPSRETRNYIEHVLTNLWIYRERFKQATPSLDAAAANEWPQYVGIDRGDASVALK